MRFEQLVELQHGHLIHRCALQAGAKHQHLSIELCSTKRTMRATALTSNSRRTNPEAIVACVSWSRTKTRNQSKPTTIADLAFTRKSARIARQEYSFLPLSLKSIISDEGIHGSLYEFPHVGRVNLLPRNSEILATISIDH